MLLTCRLLLNCFTRHNFLNAASRVRTAASKNIHRHDSWPQALPNAGRTTNQIELLLNIKTAKSLNLLILEAVGLRADKVIE